MTKFLKIVFVILILVLLGVFFSYRNLVVPLGLTSDEGGFGINAVYLEKTLHDENGFFLPVFALSLGGKEWRQPVTQYYMAVFFKLFSPSPFNLRFSSVVITLISAVLIYLLGKQFLDERWALFSALVFLTTPLVMIQSHLALDNIMPVPFTILWLLFVLLFSKSGKNHYLFWAGVSLGIGFYTYKGMRATVPVWCVLTVIYLAVLRLQKQQSWKLLGRQVLAFCLGVGPFFLVIPYLEHRYPGAVFDRQGFNFSDWYSFLLPYISSFDLSFLYIQGDSLLFHSTGKHGMMLLATLPLFLVGLYQALRKKNFGILVLGTFFGAPLLFGFVNSIHRASRLMSMIPAYVLICTLGAKEIWERKRVLLALIIVVMCLNYSDFTYYYWYKYPELTRNIFSDMSYYKDYLTFAKEIKELKLEPYVEQDVANDDGATGRFFQLSYLPDNVLYLKRGEDLPRGGILLSLRENIPGLKRLPIKTVKYRIHTL